MTEVLAGRPRPMASAASHPEGALDAVATAGSSRFTITSRAELGDALAVASKVEHCVLAEYLFAAFSCRSLAEHDDTIPGDVRNELRERQAALLRITHEEMVHLAVVQGVLAALGEPPVPDTPRFPHPPGPWGRFSSELTRFDPGSVARFEQTEAPPPWPLAALAEAPDPVRFDFLGDLYRAIIAGLRALGDDALLGARRSGVADRDWTFAVPSTVTAASAAGALAQVVVEGEGGGGGQGSHHQTFVAMHRWIDGLGDVGSRLSWPCVANPTTQQPEPDEQQATLLTHPAALSLAVAGNVAYRALWDLIAARYCFDRPAAPGEDPSTGQKPRPLKGS